MTAHRPTAEYPSPELVRIVIRATEMLDSQPGCRVALALAFLEREDGSFIAAYDSCVDDEASRMLLLGLCSNIRVQNGKPLIASEDPGRSLLNAVGGVIRELSTRPASKLSTIIVVMEHVDGRFTTLREGPAGRDVADGLVSSMLAKMTA